MVGSSLTGKHHAGIFNAWRTGQSPSDIPILESITVQRGMMYGVPYNMWSHKALNLSPGGLANLNDLARRLLIAAQMRPARSIPFHETHLEFGAHDLEAGRLGIDQAIQGNGRLIPLLIGRRQIKFDLDRRREFDDGSSRVDLLQVERNNDRCAGLVKVISARCEPGMIRSQLAREREKYGASNLTVSSISTPP